MVLVRVHHSLISSGTELAGIRADGGRETATPLERTRAGVSTARRYLGAAFRQPRRAVRRAITLARTSVAASASPARRPVAALTDLDWRAAGGAVVDMHDNALQIDTDASPGGYQAMSRPVAVADGSIPIVHLRGDLHGGPVVIGLLNGEQDGWLGSRVYQPGRFVDRLIFDTGGSSTITIVVAGGGTAQHARLTLSDVVVELAPAVVDGLPQSELDEQGWNVGYSAAGMVVAVGEGVEDLGPGDRVACAGAGFANHAEFISVPRTLACRVPRTCGLDVAATATVGAIALQGVRRAEVTLGERVAVIGLGLIGQLTVQLLRASGCTVVGLDLDPSRVERARRSGLAGGAVQAAEFAQLVRDITDGHGADAVLITAATQSHDPINLAMTICRRRGRVVIVGDVGLHVERSQFYRKEIDLRMSTSYGPGRYDERYERDGLDYPLAYVRWTLNRNLQAYLELAAEGRLDVAGLIDARVGVDEAAAAYKALAGGTQMPLAVLLDYPDDQRPLPQAPDATLVSLRGHRPAPDGPVPYALVGVGAFGTSMLVPALQKRSDALFLRAVVSRNTAAGGNFARANQVEVLTTRLEEILDDPRFGAVVIATRHHEHGTQVAAALRAGKHVFVEKPLALTWAELDAVSSALSAPGAGTLMVGFNRRFSPAMTALRAELARRRSPLLMLYRVNAGYLPTEHWVHGSQGGGRNRGEACHMYDVFRSLANSPASSVEAIPARPADEAHLRTDNFSATVAYEDGSVGTLVYTSMGPRQGLGKERLEVFADDEAYILDDFVRLTRASDGAVLWAGETDKGHAAEMDAWATAVRSGGSAPIAAAELLETTAVTLLVEDSLHGRPPADDTE